MRRRENYNRTTRSLLQIGMPTQKEIYYCLKLGQAHTYIYGEGVHSFPIAKLSRPFFFQNFY